MEIKCISRCYSESFLNNLNLFKRHVDGEGEKLPEVQVVKPCFILGGDCWPECLHIVFPSLSFLMAWQTQGNWISCMVGQGSNVSIPTNNVKLNVLWLWMEWCQAYLGNFSFREKVFQSPHFVSMISISTFISFSSIRASQSIIFSYLNCQLFFLSLHT